MTKPRQYDLFLETQPKKRRRIMMHVVDANCGDGGGEHDVNFKCARCGYDDGWSVVANISEGTRGKPCPRCNPLPSSGDTPCTP